MFSPYLKTALIAAAVLSQSSSARVLRVCADPNNLPFSNEAGTGFENKLASIVAQDLKADVAYTWWSERKSFVKNSLLAGKCDLILGIPSTLNAVLVTQPYYRSTYVFLSRADRALKISSLADDRLDKLRIGIHVVGDDYAPPAHALAQRGLAANLVGFSLFGEFGEPNPPAKLISAVSRGDVDVAILWGPFAGYFAKQSRTALDLKPVTPPMWMGIPFTYDISMAVRPDDFPLRAELDAAIARHCPAIRALLAEYGVPTVPEDGPKCDGSQPQHSVSSR
jgi:mxaJ protein